jgi:hypothetical protein
METLLLTNILLIIIAVVLVVGAVRR